MRRRYAERQERWHATQLIVGGTSGVRLDDLPEAPDYESSDPDDYDQAAVEAALMANPVVIRPAPVDPPKEG